MNHTQNENITLLKLLSDNSRFSIIKILIRSQGDICVNEIADQINITPSAVSHQLSKLEHLEIVKPVRRGQNVCYKIRNNRSSRILKEIISLLT